MEIKKTERGFEVGNFDDLYGTRCSIQQSSLATDDAIWLGVDDSAPSIMASDAIRMGLPSHGQTVGWVPFHVPPEVLLKTRMHLDREKVKELMVHLQKWLDTGSLK